MARQPSKRSVRFRRLLNLCVGDPQEFRKVVAREPNAITLRNEHLGETLLHWLAVENYEDAVALLLELGADANTTNESGNSVLADAVLLGRESIVERLLRHGADADGAPGESFPPLAQAIRKGHVRLVDLLLEAGADYRVADGEHACSSIAGALEECPAAQREEIRARLTARGWQPRAEEDDDDL